MALLNQWEEEINDKTDYLFKVCQYHGTNREKSVKALEKYDIVLTTYGIVQSEFFDEKKGERKKAKRRKKIAVSRSWYV